MVIILLLFLPAAACFFWMLINTLIARRTSTYWLSMFLALDLMLFLITDACYSTPGISPDVLVITHLFTLASAPCVIPLVWMYFDKLRRHKSFPALKFVWLIFPVALLIAGITITEVCDRASVAELHSELNALGPVAAAQYKGTPLWHYYIWNSLIFRVVIGVELFCAAAYLIRYVIIEKMNLRHFFRFLFKGESIRLTELQIDNLIIPALFVLFKTLLTKNFLDGHVWVSITLALLITVSIFVFYTTALFGERETLTVVQAKHVMFYNYNSAIKGPIQEIMMEELMDEAGQDTLVRFREKLGERLESESTIVPKEISAVKKQLMSNVTGTWDDSLLTRFQNLMLNEQLFLQPSLSLADVAERLRTNKTYVSKMVNNTYNMGFPELLNTLRIDYAEQYLRTHRDAKQEEVARACGFLSASSFNNIFKKVTGLTPKVWLVNIDRKK